MPYPQTFARHDPADFAKFLYSRIAELFPDELINHAPTECATYRRALSALRRQHPELATDTIDHPLNEADEAVHAWVGQAFTEGVEFGIAAAELWRSVMSLHEERVCRPCQGRGVLRTRDGHETDQTCAACGGIGTVETAPLLDTD